MRFKVPKGQPSSFQASARYLAGLTKGVSPDRVEWVMAHNLQTENPDAAAAIMEATAAQSTRCQTPAYHFILTFDPKDAKAKKITPDIMREIANEAIERMGLTEHQAMIYAHKDTDHPHMHFLVNRVHPQERKAYNRHEDGKRLTALCRDIARERGLNIPNERARIKDKDRMADFDDVPTSPSDGEYWRSVRLDEEPGQPYSKERIADIRQELRPIIADAMSWEVLSDHLMERGYTLQAKGQGAVISDGIGYVKLSDMGSGIRFKGLEKKFGEAFKDFEVRIAGKLKSQIDRENPLPESSSELTDQERRRAEKLHTLKQRADFERKDRVLALDDADIEFRHWSGIDQSLRRAERNERYWQRRTGQLDMTNARRGAKAHERKVAFSRALAKTYRDPESAMTIWNALEKEHGARAATMLVKKDPLVLGRMQGVEVLGGKSGSRRKADEAFKELTKRRRLWKYARDDLADTQGRLQAAKHNLTVARRDLEMMHRAIGPKDRFRRIVVEKIKLRAKALNRVTAKAIEQSELSEERRAQLTKALRNHRERQRANHLKRTLDLPREYSM